MIVNVADDDVRVPTLHVLASVLAWASAVVNPFVYAVTNRQYRTAYRRLFCGHQAPSLSPTPRQTLELVPLSPAHTSISPFTRRQKSPVRPLSIVFLESPKTPRRTFSPTPAARRSPVLSNSFATESKSHPSPSSDLEVPPPALTTESSSSSSSSSSSCSSRASSPSPLPARHRSKIFTPCMDIISLHDESRLKLISK
ncbi:hypothetical protein O3P69_013320 [Scylla paramamosain]|uniref:G-protein coupled receptors family 1 profile domain-containing protein n=1 Tax=Scylla paramamosain TaxID=85552 RepID=A0AAW0U1L6_SCYPA